MSSGRTKGAAAKGSRKAKSGAVQGRARAGRGSCNLFRGNNLFLEN